MPMNGSDYSIYLHIPFCKKKCGYCHFYVTPLRDEKQLSFFLKSLKQEIDLQREHFSSKNLVSLYFGGGTPSLLSPSHISEILSWLPLRENVEITLEATPESVTHMREFAKVGINRVSLGVQSFDDPLLKVLTREHSAQKSIEAIVETKEAGIDNISIDLMYDVPLQTEKSWDQTLAIATSLPITHLSLYNLTIEPHTSFYKKRVAIAKRQPSEELSTKLLNKAILRFEEVGLKRYEISAFAKEKYLSKHNRGYWVGRPFIGFGPSAFSFWNESRSRNIASLQRYGTILLEEKRLPIDFLETLEQEKRLREHLAIRLRLFEPLSLSCFSLSKELALDLSRCIEEGFIDKRGEWISLTPKGILFYDTVAERLV